MSDLLWYTNPYKKHERIKKNAYEQRVREVEHATFTPIVQFNVVLQHKTKGNVLETQTLRC